jgi:hypothetical protein
MAVNSVQTDTYKMITLQNIHYDLLIITLILGLQAGLILMNTLIKK